MVVMMRVLFVFGYAAAAVGRGHETVEAVADDAFAPLARDVGDVGDGGAVPTLGRVSGEGNHAATTCELCKRSHSSLAIFWFKQGTQNETEKKKKTHSFRDRARC